MLEHIQATLYDYDRNAGTRRLDSLFRGEMVNLKVVSLRPSELSLNHQNSRIRVELEAHPRYEEVISEPQSPTSQAILAELLRRTPAYETIKSELKELKQREPGTVSVNGRVINGNTRLVAIRDLGWDHFDAGVLPDSATDEDFKEIELGLQLVMTTKQAYSFVNRLRLFEELLKDKPIDEICKLMGWRMKKTQEFDKFKLILSIVNEYANQGIPKTFFEAKEEYLKNLADRVKSLTESGRVADTQRIKDIRLIGMLCGSTKDEVREMEPDFIERFVDRRVEDSKEAKDILHPKDAEAPGKDDLEDLFPSVARPTSIAVSEVVRLISLEASAGASEASLDQLRVAVRLAGDDAVQAKKRSSMKTAPSQMLVTCQSDLNKIRVKIKELESKRESLSQDDVEAFNNGLRRVRLELETLEAEFSSFQSGATT